MRLTFCLWKSILNNYSSYRVCITVHATREPVIVLDLLWRRPRFKCLLSHEVFCWPWTRPWALSAYLILHVILLKGNITYHPLELLGERMGQKGVIRKLMSLLNSLELYPIQLFWSSAMGLVYHLNPQCIFLSHQLSTEHSCCSCNALLITCKTWSAYRHIKLNYFFLFVNISLTVLF